MFEIYLSQELLVAIEKEEKEEEGAVVHCPNVKCCFFFFAREEEKQEKRTQEELWRLNFRYCTFLCSLLFLPRLFSCVPRLLFFLVFSLFLCLSCVFGLLFSGVFSSCFLLFFLLCLFLFFLLGLLRFHLLSCLLSLFILLFLPPFRYSFCVSLAFLSFLVIAVGFVSLNSAPIVLFLLSTIISHAHRSLSI